MLFWGLHPTNMTHVKCDHVPSGAQGVPIPMPLQLATLYTNSLYQHNTANCLKCCRNQAPLRPRSCSMSIVLSFIGNSLQKGATIGHRMCMGKHTHFSYQCDELKHRYG